MRKPEVEEANVSMVTELFIGKDLGRSDLTTYTQLLGYIVGV